MATPTGLYGPFDLTERMIDDVIQYTLPGAYALGPGVHSDVTAIIVRYVGRSDADLSARLKQHVGRYPKFLCSTFASAKEAFEKECWLYHTFNPAGNVVHPARPQNIRCNCPMAGCSTLFY